MFGGAMPSIAPDGIPSDIQIRRNYFYKPDSWRTSGAWSVKNLFEIKFARRVLLEGNVLDGNWTDAQDGMAFNIKYDTQEGTCTWCVSEDIPIRSNVTRNSDGGIKIANAPRTTIENNILENIGARANGRLFIFLNGAPDLRVERNTGFSTNITIAADGAAHSRFVLRDNLLGRAQYGIKGNSQSEGINTLNHFFPGAVLSGNALVGGDPSRYPTGFEFLTTVGAYTGTAGVNRTVLDAAIRGVVVSP